MFPLEKVGGSLFFIKADWEKRMRLKVVFSVFEL